MSCSHFSGFGDAQRHGRPADRTPVEERPVSAAGAGPVRNSVLGQGLNARYGVPRTWPARLLHLLSDGGEVVDSQTIRRVDGLARGATPCDPFGSIPNRRTLTYLFLGLAWILFTGFLGYIVAEQIAEDVGVWMAVNEGLR